MGTEGARGAASWLERAVGIPEARRVVAIRGVFGLMATALQDSNGILGLYERFLSHSYTKSGTGN